MSFLSLEMINAACVQAIRLKIPFLSLHMKMSGTNKKMDWRKSVALIKCTDPKAIPSTTQTFYLCIFFSICVYACHTDVQFPLFRMNTTYKCDLWWVSIWDNPTKETRCKTTKTIILHVRPYRKSQHIIHFMRCRFHTYSPFYASNIGHRAIRYKPLCAHVYLDRFFGEPFSFSPSISFHFCLSLYMVCFFSLARLFLSICFFLLSFGRLFSFKACIRDMLCTHTITVSVCTGRFHMVRATYSFYDYNM